MNHELLPVQLPFTYAHELAHLLGVSSEAEANFWAYQVCIHSTDAGIRYSGYFGLLPYVVVNTRGLLSETEFKSWLDTIRPEIIKQLYDKEAYWDDRYNKLLGKLQNVVYNWYLKVIRFLLVRKLCAGYRYDSFLANKLVEVTL